MESYMDYRNEGDTEQVFIGTVDTGISPCCLLAIADFADYLVDFIKA